MNGYSYASPKLAKITVNPLGEVNGKAGEGVGGYGYSVASYNFDTGKGDLRDGKGFSVISGFLPYAAKRIYYYRRISGEDVVLDRALVWCADGYVYSLKLAGGTPTKLAALYFTKEPSAVNYNFNGEDVMIFSSENGEMKIYDGTNVITVSSAPKVESMCIHGERLFLTDSSNHNSLWFSDDFDPNNWTISSTEAGYIDFSDDLGNAIKVVSFLNYLFVFRDYGIMRLTAYGDQNDFLMKKVFTDTGRIYKNSIVSCGDKIMFCAEDGVYAFDGYEAVKVGKEFPKITDKKTVCAGYLDNKYYLACKLAQPGDLKNDSVIRFDTETKDISVLTDVQVAGFCCLKSAKDATLLCYFTGDNKNKLGMMSESGKVFETVTTKIYESPENTLGSPYYKTIRGASVFTKYPITLKVILDGKEYKFNIAAKDTQQYIPIEKCGIRVKFEIEAQTAHAYVSPISVDVDVERRTL